MRRTRRFPHRLVRGTSLCVCFAFVLSFLAVVPFPRLGRSLAQGLGSPNGQGTSVPAPPPLPGPPAANLPNLDQVRTRPQRPPEAPMPLPSVIRSRRSPLEPRNGRRVGDPGTTLIGAGYGTGSGSDGMTTGSAGMPRAASVRVSSPTVREGSVTRRAIKASKLNHARMTRSRAALHRTNAAPAPIADDQYVQSFFTWALARQPNAGEQTYWNDILRVAYAKGQTSMVMGARELGKTLFESSEYAARGRNDHWYVYDLFKTYLLRDPDSGGWAYWESQVPLIGREATRRAFDESGEFIYWVGTITPNGSASSAVSSLLTARVDPNNQPGGGLLTRDATWGVSLLSLPGRAGLDLGLGLSYSSSVWTRSGPYIYFDEDDGWPSPGFRLGFPTIQEKFFDAQVGVNAYVMIASSGRVELRQIGASNVYEAADSSCLQLTDNGTSLLLRTTDGTQMSYAKFQDEWRCTQIKDRNGNYLSVSYDWLGHISSITDTLGRVITVNYDSKANQTSIDQTWNGQTHTWATFGWGTVNIQTSFSGVAVSGAPNGTIIPVLTMVGFDDGTYCKFLYNGAAQVTRVTNYASDSNPFTDNHPRNYTAFDYGAGDDSTRLIATRVWAENWNGINGVPAEVTVQQFSLPGDGSHQLLAPDNTIYKEFYGTGWQKGLTTLSEVWSGGVKQKWTTVTWTQDNPGVSYQTNPRVTETNVYDAAGNRSRSTVSYSNFTFSGGSAYLPTDTYEFAADAATVLRRNHTDYNLASAYSDRRIIGLPAAKYVCNGAQGQVPCNDASGASLFSKVTLLYDESGSVQNPGSPIQHDNTNYGTSFVVGRGNVSSARRHDINNLNQFTASSIAYNTAGAPVSTTDPLGHQATLIYTDAFSDTINRNTFAYPTILTDGGGFSSYLQYNYDFGAKTRAQGPPPAGQSQGVIQTFSYDSAARLLQTTTTNNGAYTRYVYAPTYVQSYATVNNVADEAFSIQVFDGAGRPITNAANHPGSTGLYRAVNTIYDSMGRAFKVSNPAETNGSWNPTGDDAAGWLYTQQTYDWKGRPLVTTNTDGTQKSASYSACGCAGSEVTTLTDEMGRRQKIYSDVLGRTAKAEVLNWNSTVYSTSANTFNALDQVTRVRQFQGTDASGTYQDTTATFDGYGRLKTKHVPEQQVDVNNSSSTDHTTWDHNNDDTIQKITDARGASATYSYNSRHLPTAIVYAAPTVNPPGSAIPVTPSVSFNYDAAGNRTLTTSAGNSSTYQYDQLSRLTSETYQFSDLTGSYALNYAYNLANELTSLSIPFTSQSVGYNYDSTGRLSSVAASGFSASYTTPWPNSQTFTQPVTSFLSSISYRASGARKSVTYGNTVSESINYNSRLQPTSYTLNNVNYVNTYVWPNTSSTSMSWTYDYYADAQLNHAYDSSWNFWDRSYAYDHAGRFQEADTNRVARGQSWDYWHPDPYKQTSTYDVWNNLKLTGYLYNNVQNDFETYTNNRRSGSFYDAEANVTLTPGGFSNSINAAGHNVGAVSTQHVGDGTPQFPEQPKEEITQTYEGNGRPCKRTDIRREDVRDEETGNLIQVQEETLTDHYIYSSVLGAQVVDLDGYGQNKTWVFADGQRIATAISGAYSNTTFEHHNPATGSRVTINGHSSSRAAAREERDPQLAPVSLAGGSFSGPNWNQPMFIEGGDPSDFVPGVTVDGMPVTRADLARRLGSGSLAVPYLINGLHVVQGPITPLGLGIFEVDYPKPDNEGWHWSARIFFSSPGGPQNPAPRPDLPGWVRDFYKKHQGQIDRCINKVFGQLWNGTPDVAATVMARQTIKNAPELDVTISQGPLSVYTGDPATQGTFSLTGSLGHGTVYIASNLYGTISQDERNRTYFHELGNILSAQITGDARHFGDPRGIGTHYLDPDTGARLEKCIFGSVPF
jgi:YD repeat-containing protein